MHGSADTAHLLIILTPICIALGLFIGLLRAWWDVACDQEKNQIVFYGTLSVIGIFGIGLLGFIMSMIVRMMSWQTV